MFHHYNEYCFLIPKVVDCNSTNQIISTLAGIASGSELSIRLKCNFEKKSSNFEMPISLRCTVKIIDFLCCFNIENFLLKLLPYISNNDLFRCEGFIMPQQCSVRVLELLMDYPVALDKLKVLDMSKTNCFASKSQSMDCFMQFISNRNRLIELHLNQMTTSVCNILRNWLEGRNCSLRKVCLENLRVSLPWNKETAHLPLTTI